MNTATSDRYSISWQGPMYPDYFQGAGTCGTPWDRVAVGSGSDLATAYEDACDFAYQGGELDGADCYYLPPFLACGLAEDNAKLEPLEEDSESLYFVVVYYNLPDAKGA